MPPRRKALHDHDRSEVWERPSLVRAIEREKAVLGRRLRELRKERDLSQEEAAERMGIHAKHLQRMEMGRPNITIATMVAVATAYGVPLSALFNERRK